MKVIRSEMVISGASRGDSPAAAVSSRLVNAELRPESRLRSGGCCVSGAKIRSSQAKT